MAALGLPAFFQRRGVLLFLTTAFFTLLVLLLFNLRKYQEYENLVRDTLVTEGRLAERNPEVVVLAIDTPSTLLDELWDDELQESPALPLMKRGTPFHRAVYAHIADRIAAAGAKVIAFDVEFPLRRDGDAELAGALARHRDRIVIGMNLYEDRHDVGNKQQIRPPGPDLKLGEPKSDPRVGFVNFRSDLDGKVRGATYRTTMVQWHKIPPLPNDPEMFSLSARMAQRAGYGARVPKDYGTHLFRWSKEYEMISVYQIFLKAFWEKPPMNGGALFKDKIVLVGPFGNWAKDELQTPLGLTPGPHIHLSALNALLTGDFLRETTLWENIALIVGAGALAWLLGILISGAILRMFVLLGIVVGYGALALFLYNSRGFYPILLSPVLALTLSGGTWLALERFLEALERMRLRHTLEQFVSRDVVREMLDNKESYLNTLFGGARKPITVLFSDVRGFTSVTESANAEVLVGQLREYFTAMVRIVFAQFGTLDKFIGDAVMASWGAIGSRGPGPDACRAVAAGMEMLRQLPKLNASWKARGLTEFKIGIGINHGEAICGYIGSEEKREFTSIGDAVNLASRLEGATKEFHVDLLLGEATAELVREQFTLRTVGLIRVKGKTKPVECFTVVDLPRGSGRPAWLECYESGIARFRRREFAEAEQDFAQAAQLQTDDWLTQEYLRRTREYQTTPPEEGWDAVFIMATK